METNDLLNEFVEAESLKHSQGKNAQKKRKVMEKFFAFVQISPLSVTKEDIVMYLDSLKEKGSYNRKLSYLNQFFEFLLDREYILINPAINIDRLKTERENHFDIFTEEEIKKIIQSTLFTPTGKRDRAIIELFYSTGIRISELAGLNMDDIDFRNHEVYVIKGKFSRDRIVPVGEKALKALKGYIKDRESFLDPCNEYEALFLSSRGNRFSISALRKMIHRRKGNAGVESKGAAHAFRHSCATHLLKNGAPMPIIQRLLGHDHLKSTQIYTHIGSDDLKSKYSHLQEDK